MKAKELMIGDWVRCGKRYMKVTQLAEDMDCDDIEPIPLTPEILEKNGWKSYSHENTPIYGMIKGFEIVLAWMDYYWQLCVDGTLYRKIRIRYIHDIQHALKLCGIEKTIEL